MADPTHDERHPRTPDFNVASPWGVVECTAPRLCITPHVAWGGEVFGVCVRGIVVGRGNIELRGLGGCPTGSCANIELRGLWGRPGWILCQH